MSTKRWPQCSKVFCQAVYLRVPCTGCPIKILPFEKLPKFDYESYHQNVFLICFVNDPSYLQMTKFPCSLLKGYDILHWKPHFELCSLSNIVTPYFHGAAFYAREENVREHIV